MLCACVRACACARDDSLDDLGGEIGRAGAVWRHSTHQNLKFVCEAKLGLSHRMGKSALVFGGRNSCTYGTKCSRP